MRGFYLIAFPGSLGGLDHIVFEMIMACEIIPNGLSRERNSFLSFNGTSNKLEKYSFFSLLSLR